MSMVPSPNAPREGDKAAADAEPAPAIRENEVPLSQSLIWARQREFYEQRGLKAWTEDRVPSYITNNPFTAEIYARIVFAFLRECIQPEDANRRISPGTPLRILELGAGTGKFSLLFMRELASLMRAGKAALSSVRYCLTDCAESVLEAWRSNPYLADLVTAGILEFELFHAGEPIQSPFLQGPSESERGPLVVIANYVFDSLPQDAFVIEPSRIVEAMITTSAPGETAQAADSSSIGPSAAAADSISRWKFSFTNAAVPPDRYSDPAWNRILDDYRQRLSPGATILFPCGALAVLREIARFSDGRMLVLSGDKGHAHEDALLLSQGPPSFEFHAANCLSQMVNLDAIAKYFEAVGGRALRPDKHASSFSICGFLACRPGEQFPATQAAYRETQQAFGPDDLFTLFAWLDAHMEEMSVPQILAALRLTRWDTTAFMRLFPVLARRLHAVVAERHDLHDAVLRVWANRYPVNRSDNHLAFQCGVILLELKFFEEAVSMFRASQKMFGPSAPTSYNLGLCLDGLGRLEEALDAMKEACRLDPGFQPAQDALRKREREQAGKTSRESG